MRILVVEDEPVSQRIMAKLLSDLGQITTADDGLQALTRYKQALADGDAFDLIALDIMMPEMNGHELLREIRSFEDSQNIGESRRVKVVMTTALSDARTVVAAFDHGCEAYLVKPIERNVLYSELRKLGIEPPTH